MFSWSFLKANTTILWPTKVLIRWHILPTCYSLHVLVWANTTHPKERNSPIFKTKWGCTIISRSVCTTEWNNISNKTKGKHKSILIDENVEKAIQKNTTKGKWKVMFMMTTDRKHPKVSLGPPWHPESSWSVTTTVLSALTFQLSSVTGTQQYRLFNPKN